MSEGLSGAGSYEGSVRRIGPERTGASRGTVARSASLPGVSAADTTAGAAERAKASGQGLPVARAPAGPLPHEGLRSGATVAVPGSTPLPFALLAEVAARGSGAAVTGTPWPGLVAAEELGVELFRPEPAPHPGAEFPAVTAAAVS